METTTLVARLRRLGMEPSDVETRSAVGGLPAAVVETIAAFAKAELDAVLQAIRAGSMTTRALSEQLGLSERTVGRRLSVLAARGRVAPTHPTRSSKQSYRLVSPEES